MPGDSKARAKRQSLRRVKTAEAMWGYLFIAPNFLGMLALMILPLITSLALSFTNWDIISTPKFVGLRNYVRTMPNDQQFINAVVNTAKYSLLYIPISIVLALFVAYLLSRGLRGENIFRAAVFVPVTLSMVSVSLIWRWLLHTDYGVVNWVLSLFRIPAAPWLASEHVALLSVVMISVWKNLGFNTVILIAGFKGISRSLVEAADLDGASEWQKLRYVSLPMVSPSLFFVSIMSVINSFQVFDVVYMTTKGGPGDSTRVLYYWIYQNAFRTFKIGYASAMAWALFLVIFILTMINMRFGERRVTYDVD